MPSLKEVKTRIVSVQSTRKITSAMKMVASSKLHKAQQAIESMRPYERQLSHIMTAFVSGLHGDVTTPLATVRQPGHVVLVAVSSNSSLCGSARRSTSTAKRVSKSASSPLAVRLPRLYVGLA